MGVTPPPSLDEAVAAQAASEGIATSWRSGGRTSLVEPLTGGGLGRALAGAPGRPGTTTSCSDVGALAARGRIVGTTSDGVVVTAYRDLVVALGALPGPGSPRTRVTTVARVVGGKPHRDLRALAASAGDRLLPEGERIGREGALRSHAPTATLLAAAADVLAFGGATGADLLTLRWEGGPHGGMATGYDDWEEARDVLVDALRWVARGMPARLTWTRSDEGHPDLESGWRWGLPDVRLDAPRRPASTTMATAARAGAAARLRAWARGAGLPGGLLADVLEVLGEP